LEAALNAYNQLTTPDADASVTSGLAHLSLNDSELNQIQADNNAAVQRARDFDDANDHGSIPHNAGNHSNNPYLNNSALHPDLADLDFNAPSHNLPPPIRPTSAPGSRGKERGVDEDRRGSLSDYSDYESSDGETYIAAPKKRTYVTISDNSGDEGLAAAGPATQPKSGPAAQHNTTHAKVDNNPFADPFA
jgi:hypothetical protein